MTVSLSPVYAAIINAGVGTFIACLVLVGLYKILDGFGRQLVEAQQQQAAALSAQAQSMQSMTMALNTYVNRDQSDHREMLTLLRFLAQRQERMKEICDERDGCEA